MQKVKLRLHYKYCMPAWISFISDWPNMSQWLSVEGKKGKKEQNMKKKSTLLNWCTTHVSASWLGREIRGKCRKICFLQQRSRFPFNSAHSAFWPLKKKRMLHWLAIYTICGISNHTNNKPKMAFLVLHYLALCMFKLFFFIWAHLFLFAATKLMACEAATW